MKKEIKINFIQYALENLDNIKVPNSKDKFYKFENLENLCELLILFLNYEIDDSNLKRVLSNFENEFQIIYEFDIKKLSSAIESLAANFEPFLKKLAYIKFNNDDLWYGNSNHKGIIDSTLFELIEGGFAIPNEKFKILQFPSEIVSKTGPSKAILDFVRSNLRNSVHDAKAYTRIQLAEYSNLVLSSYLIAINDNIDFLKEKFFIEYDYLKQISNSVELKIINSNYVDILGKELESNKSINNFSNIELGDLNIESETDYSGIDTIINIANEQNNFIIIGEPGSGKSTSLKKIAFNNAHKLLENSKSGKFPILIKASLYSRQNNYEKLIQNEISPINLEYLLKKYKITILIDGINEIEDDFKPFAIKDLIHTINYYKNIDFVITTRKFGFYNNLNVRVYELKSFNELQIKDFINKGLRSTTEANNFWTNIESNQTILEIVANPLMLNMFLNVFKNENKNIPQNKALLYKLFIDKILEREKSYSNTKIKTKIDILSYIAFWMRSNGYFKNINSIKAKELINSKLIEIDHSIGSNQLIDELIDNNLISEKDENIEFQHETIQEYFVSLELKNQFLALDRLNINVLDNKWADSLIMCAQLLKNEQDLNNYYNHLFVGQRSNNIKPINLFDQNDVNEGFYIGCKISYNIKDTYPTVYKLSEIHLQNYISLWLLNYKKNIQIFNFENLLIAVATLSSVNIFKSFFTNISVLEYFLHDNNENIDINSNPDFESEFDKKFTNLASLFSESLNNTANFYKANTFISDFIDNTYNFNISKTIRPNYKKFLQYILNESSTSQLIEVFKVEPDKEILFFIGATDLTFFVNNYSLINKINPQKVVNFLLKYHFKNPNLFEIITNIILKDTTSIEDKCEIIFTLLKFKQFQEETFLFLKKQKIENEIFLLEDSFKLLLNNYPLQILKEYELDTLYVTPDIIEDKLLLNRINSDEIHHYYEVQEYKNMLINNDIYIKEKKIEPNFKEIEFACLRIKLNMLEQLIDLKKEYEENKIIILEYNDPKDVQNAVFLKLKLRKIQKSKKYYNSILLYLDTLLPDELINRDINKVTLHLKHKYEGLLDSVTIYSKINTLQIGINSNFELQDILQLRLIKPNINFEKPHLYHREILKNNKFYTNYLKSSIDDIDKHDFYKKLSLLHLSNNLNIYDINYGVVINESFLNWPCYIVYSISKNKVISNYLYATSDSNIQINDVVIIENNIHISPIINFDNIYSPYITSNISTYNIERGEGFIKNVTDDKDYYFIAKHSNYLPKIGDYIKFIPGINFSKKTNKMRPMAFSISKIEKHNKIATVFKQLAVESNNKDCFEYLLSDDITNETLFTRIYTSSLNSINHELEIGQKYSYTDHTSRNTSDQNNISRLKRIIVLDAL